MPSQTYVVKFDDMAQLVALLGDALEIRFVLHNSLYRAGDYYRAVPVGNDAEFIVQRNWDALEGEPLELEYADWPFIFYVSSTRRSDLVLHQVDQVLGNRALLVHS